MITEDIEGLADIEGLPTVIGFLVIVDGLKPKWDGTGPKVFATYQAAQAAADWLDVVSPSTAADVERWRRRFDGGRGSGHN